MRTSQKERDRRMHENHQCTDCGAVDELTLAGHWRCKKCRAYQRKRYSLIQGPQRAARYQYRRENQLCGRCGKQDELTLAGKSLCAVCMERNRISVRKHYLKTKKANTEE